jgi:hypothetical protein
MLKTDYRSPTIVSMRKATAIPSSPDKFIHEPLDLTKSTIRLLQIHPRRGEDTIQCTLKRVSRRDASYVCLSYTWGEPQPAHRILVNHKWLDVRENLYNFLWLARKIGIKYWLWIDACCIDQENVLERNHQVQQMADIYRGARHVLVYPGYCPRRLRLASTLACCDIWLSADEDIRYAAPCYFRRVLHKLVFYGFQSTIEEAVLFHYWSRCWIIQELMAARKCYVVSAAGLIQWQSFLRLYRMCEWRLSLWPSNVKVFCGYSSGATQLHSRKLNLDSLLSFIFQLGPDSFTCADRRDYVYSLLGLTEGAQGFAVDYGTTTVSLFLDAIQHFKLVIEDSYYVMSTFQILMQALQVTVVSYCRICAEPVPDEIDVISRELGEEYVFALLVVGDERNRTTRCKKSHLCKTYNGRLIPGCRLRNNTGDHFQHLFRAGLDKMYCLTHQKYFY